MENNLEIGQILYIHTRHIFTEDDNLELLEYKITKINTTSVYVESTDETKRRIKLDKKTLSTNNYTGIRQKAYLDPKDFHNEYNDKILVTKLRKDILKNLSGLSKDKLITISKIIEK